MGNTNPVKLGRCLEFLQKWYGIQYGNNQFCGSPNNSESITQKQLAESYGITQQTMNNYMRIANMIPELEDLVDTGIVTMELRCIYI